MPKEPSAAILKELSLTSKQLKTTVAIAGNPDGMTREALQALYDLPNEEFEDLVKRYILKQTGDHYHASNVGAFIVKTAAELDQATPGD